MHPARLIDPDHITVYESSGFWKPYYTTSMGLFMQATEKSVKRKWEPGEKGMKELGDFSVR